MAKKEAVDPGPYTRKTYTHVEWNTLYGNVQRDHIRAGDVFIAVPPDEYEKMLKATNEVSRLTERLEHSKKSADADATEKRGIIQQRDRDIMRLKRAAHSLVEAISEDDYSLFAQKLMMR